MEKIFNKIFGLKGLKELEYKVRPSCSSNVSVYFTPFPLGQFYAISFEGNVDPPSTEEEIQRVKVYLC